jgi:phage-related protein
LIKTGIKFGEIHSFFDLNLILSAVKIPPAAPKTTYVEVPGADGSVDLTEAHGEVRYSDRQLEFTFTAHPLDAMKWEERKTAVSNALNGKRCRITLDSNPDYYYDGRVVVKMDSSFARDMVTREGAPEALRAALSVCLNRKLETADILIEVEEEKKRDGSLIDLIIEAAEE